MIRLTGGKGQRRIQRRRQFTELIHEGKYAAAVVVELSYTDESRSPNMALDDAEGGHSLVPSTTQVTAPTSHIIPLHVVAVRHTSPSGLTLTEQLLPQLSCSFL
jgi:hypothetical protein